MMKKIVFVLFLLLTFSACNRFRVRHDHSQKMQQVRIAVDTVHKHEVEGPDKNWDEEDLIAIPPEIGAEGTSDISSEEIERLMKGEDVDFGE